MKHRFLAAVIILVSLQYSYASSLTWARAYYPRGFVEMGPTSVELMPDGGFVAATPTEILRLNRNGSIIWSRHSALEAVAPLLIKPAKDGGLLLAAQTQILDRSANDSIVKLDVTGNLVWQTTLTNSSEEYFPVRDFFETADGGIVLFATRFTVPPAGPTVADSLLLLWKLSSSGGLVWKRCFNAAGATNAFQDADGTFIVGTERGSILKMSATGNVLWQRKFTSSFLTINDGVSPGTLIAAGISGNSGILFSLSTQGVVQWAKTFSLPGAKIELNRVSKTSDGYVLAGSIFQAGYFVPFAMKVDREGDVIWSRRMEDDFRTYANSYDLASLNDGGLILATRARVLYRLSPNGLFGGICAAHSSPLALSVANLSLTGMRRSPSSVDSRLTVVPASPIQLTAAHMQSAPACRPAIFADSITASRGKNLFLPGRYFGPSQGASKILLGGRNLGRAISWSDSSVVFQIPQDAHSGLLHMVIDGVSSNAVTVTITAL